MTETPVESPSPTTVGPAPLPSYAGAVGWLLYPIAFLLRLRTIDGVFAPFGTFPLATDSYYHLRRIQLTAWNFPHVPDFDRYVNFPAGAATHWPFGFDFLYAAIARATCPGALDDGWIIAVACLLTPLIGALTPCVAYRIGLLYGGIRAGVFAGLIVAAAEVVIIQTSIGYIDHHVFESFWMAVALWLWLPALKDGDVAGRRAIRVVLSGAAVGAGLICATVLPLLVPLFAGMFGVLLWRARHDRGRLTALMFAGGLHWTGTALFLAPFVATRLAEPTGVNPSIGLVWAAAFGLSGSCLAAAFGLKRRNGGRGDFGWLVVWAALAVFVVPRLAFGEIGAFLVYGLGHVVASDPWLAAIAESQPVFRAPLANVFSGYTGVIFAFPVLLGWWVLRAREAAPERLALTVLAGATFALAMLQWKFAGLFIVPFAVLSGVALDELSGWLAERWPEQAGAARVGVLAAVVALILPGIHYRVTYVVMRGDRFVNLYPTLQWMDLRTPRTSATGAAASDYGVVTDWDVGHWVIWFAGRPVVTSPLGHTLPMRIGIRDGAAMLVAPPPAAVGLMETRRMRYVLVTPMNLGNLLETAFWDERTGKTRPFPADPNLILGRSFYAALALADSVPGDRPEASGLRRFRLVHEDPEKTAFDGVAVPLPVARLFELVAGAVIRGKAAPGEVVKITARIRTDAGREFDYVDVVRADANGDFECRLPYAQGKQAFSGVAAVTPYRVTIQGKESRFTASEQDVLEGRPARAEQ
jgi:dolichyl-diphosphooligosaccharide--protein glycosyltransferase